MHIEAYVFRSGIWCTDCAEKHMREAWPNSSVSAAVCPICDVPLRRASTITLAEMEAAGWRHALRTEINVWLEPDGWVCFACAACETNLNDIRADSDTWPQAIVQWEPSDEGEYCAACMCEIAEPSDAYKAIRALEKDLPSILDTIHRGETYGMDKPPLPRIMSALAEEWADDEIASAAADLPGVTSDLTERSADTIIRHIRTLATERGYHTVPAFLASPEWAAIMETV